MHEESKENSKDNKFNEIEIPDSSNLNKSSNHSSKDNNGEP